MSRIEASRTLRVPVEEVFNFIDDFRRWPQWCACIWAIAHPEQGVHRCRENAWSKPGDTVRGAGRAPGHHFPIEVVLEERREPELIRFTVLVPGLARLAFAWRCEKVDEGSMLLTVQAEGEARSGDNRTLAALLARQAEQSLDSLERILSRRHRALAS